MEKSNVIHGWWKRSLRCLQSKQNSNTERILVLRSTPIVDRKDQQPSHTRVFCHIWVQERLSMVPWNSDILEICHIDPPWEQQRIQSVWYPPGHSVGVAGVAVISIRSGKEGVPESHNRMRHHNDGIPRIRFRFLKIFHPYLQSASCSILFLVQIVER